MSPRLRRAAAGITIIVGLCSLAWLPAGGKPAYLAQLAEFKNRAFENRYLDFEVTELAFLDCIEQGLRAIPEGASLSIKTNDAYLIQRIAEITYPRLLLVEGTPDFEVFVNPETMSGSVTVSQFDCAQVKFLVMKYG